MRLIDANRLEEAFAKECTAECPICSYYKSDAEVDVECHCGLINNAPTVTEFVSSPVELVKVGEHLANSVAITKALEKGELYKRGFDDGYKRGKEERLKNKWIPVKYRPLSVDERIAFAEYCGIGYSDARDEKAFDCPMPEDGKEILISTAWGVRADVACNDMDGEGFFCYGLENNGDWDGVDAWMPMPAPYKDEE